MSDSMENKIKLATKLRELFDIKYDKKGEKGVFSEGGSYEAVLLELNNFSFDDVDFKKLVEAQQFAGAKGFYMLPQAERESKARHAFVFHF